MGSHTLSFVLVSRAMYVFGRERADLLNKIFSANLHNTYVSVKAYRKLDIAYNPLYGYLYKVTNLWLESLKRR